MLLQMLRYQSSALSSSPENDLPATQEFQHLKGAAKLHATKRIVIGRHIKFALPNATMRETYGGAILTLDPPSLTRVLGKSFTFLDYAAEADPVAPDRLLQCRI
jgi:hypothetical protein